jgi:hypothetical protein
MKPLVVTILVIAAGGPAFSGYLRIASLFASAPAECDDRMPLVPR